MDSDDSSWASEFTPASSSLASPAPFPSPVDLLDDEHKTVLQRAVANILSLDSVENVFAQLLDGLPTAEGLEIAYPAVLPTYPPNHPVCVLQHNEICDGFLAKARELRQKFGISEISFQPWVIEAFQAATPGTKEFCLRLIELVVVSCHEIAAYLYDRDDDADSTRAHPRQLHDDWYAEMDRLRQIGGLQWRMRNLSPRPVVFSHREYNKPERCPRGEADVAGYWAEGFIFGGVVVFDRGESERECKSMWLHGAQFSPVTLYPPTDAQFDALVAFLLSDPDTDVNHDAARAACPLPIHGTPLNRPRWDPYEALTKFHIFRDKDALEIPAKRYFGCTTLPSKTDWPELDGRGVGGLWRFKENGEPYSDDELAEVIGRIGPITPTSPIWYPRPDWMMSLETVDAGHSAAFLRALNNLLMRPETEVTYAQIVDGLPLLDVYRQSHRNARTPALLEHKALCPGVLSRVRAFRDRLDVTALRFQSHTVQAFQECAPGSTAFCLRLIELLAVACHQIAVALFRLDDGIHSRRAQEAQLAADLAAELANVPASRYWERRPVPPQTYFYNSRYTFWRQYPDGVADVVGYWAETRIFGGVVVFDRGVSGLACDGVYLHSDREGAGRTMYPPSEAQFRALVAFLTVAPPRSTAAEVEKPERGEGVEPETPPDPLPIIGSLDNRWRWHPYYGFRDYNIYRDRHERKPLPPSRHEGHRRDAADFPEYEDVFVITQQGAAPVFGDPVDEEALQRARETSRMITPTSPCWRGAKPPPVEGRALWKSP